MQVNVCVLNSLKRIPVLSNIITLCCYLRVFKVASSLSPSRHFDVFRHLDFENKESGSSATNSFDYEIDLSPLSPKANAPSLSDTPFVTPKACSSLLSVQDSHEHAAECLSEEEQEEHSLSIRSSQAAWSYESPKKFNDSFLSVTGPSPGRPPFLVREVPNTEKRNRKRSNSMKAICRPMQLTHFENWKLQLETNQYLRALIDHDILAARMKSLEKAQMKKCFTVVQIVVYEKIINVLHALGFETVQDTFWSSCKTIEQEDAAFVGVDKATIRSASGRKDVFPLQDHHSERASVMWLSKEIGYIFKRILGGSAPGVSRYVVHINLLTKFSSCRSCAIIFGFEDNFSRIPDLFQKVIAEELIMPIEQAPDVTIVHQGLKHYHHETRHKTQEMPLPEFFCSKSFL
jgi:hypothetical protein